MLKRLIRYKLTILAIALTSLPVSLAQSLTKPDRDWSRRSNPMRISSYEDDPFVAFSLVQRMDPSRFGLGADGRPILLGSLVRIQDEPRIFRQDPTTGLFNPFAWNPWPAPTSNLDGDFRFPDEERFP